MKELVEKGKSTILLEIFQFIDEKMTEFLEKPENKEKWMTESYYDKIQKHFGIVR